MSKISKKKALFLNSCFVIVGGAILLFLLNAPEETTAKLPKDEIHADFFAIKSKKEAEKNCTSCHSETGDAPLSEEHPPKFRCLFCHKR